MADEEQGQIRYEDLLKDPGTMSFAAHWRSAQVTANKLYDTITESGGMKTTLGESLQIAQLEATLAVAAALKEIHSLSDGVEDSDD